MGSKTIEVGSAAEAFQVLSDFAVPSRGMVFRGHRDARWRLESTLARHVRGGFPCHSTK